MEILTTAKVFVLNPNNELLLLRRSDDPAIETHRPGALDLPGGEVEDGEPPEYAARFELFEECGLHIASLALTKLVTREDPSKYGHWNIRHFFIAETDVADPPVELPGNRGEEAVWASLGYAFRNIGHPVQLAVMAAAFGVPDNLVLPPFIY